MTLLPASAQAHKHSYRSLCELLSAKSDPSAWGVFSSSDWENFSRLALGEGVAPLAYATLKQIKTSPEQQVDPPETGLLIPPSAVDARLAQSYYQSAAFHTVLDRELERILPALNRAGVAVVLLKGAALARSVYADPALRPMNDLDLLVRRADLPAALRALRTIGYQRLADNYIRYHVFLMGGPSAQLALELHWSLVSNAERFPLLLDWFWGQAAPLDPAQPLSCSLRPTGQLLYLAVHLALQHSQEARLIWYLDLHLLLTQLGDQVDWDDLFQQAGKMGWAAALHRALTETHQRFSTPLPQEFLDRLAQSALSQPDAAVSRIGSASDSPSMLGAKAWRALTPSDRLRMAWGLLFPRPAYLRWRYHPNPEWLWPFVVVRRWVDVFWGRV